MQTAQSRRAWMGGVALVAFAAGTALGGISPGSWSQTYVAAEPYLLPPQSFDGVNSDGLPAAEDNILLGTNPRGAGTIGIMGHLGGRFPVTSTAITLLPTSTTNYAIATTLVPGTTPAQGRQGVIIRYDVNSGYVAAIDYGAGEFVLARFDRAGPTFAVLSSSPIAGFTNTSSYHVRISARGSTVYADAFNVSGAGVGTNVASVSAPVNPINSFGPGGLFVRADSQAVAGEMLFANIAHKTLSRDVFGSSFTPTLFFSNANGELWSWAYSGTSLVSATQLPGLPQGFEIATTADFDDNRIADVIIHNRTTGQTRLLLKDNTGATTRTVTLPTVGANTWEVVGAGDLSLDGLADILYRNVNTNQLWLRVLSRTGTSGNPTYTTTSVRPYLDVPAGWELQAVADFAGFGYNDLFFRNDDGSNGIVRTVGATPFSWVPMPWAPTGWEVVGTGDFNVDSRNDLIWRNTDGALYAWTLDGLTLISAAALPTPGATFDAQN